MFTIPSDLYEEKLTMWIYSQLANSAECPNEKVFCFLLKLSRCQMMDRERGEKYPYIMDFNPTDEELSFVLDNSFDKSDNVEIRAYSLDLLQQKAKDKRQAQIDASSAYLELFDKTDSPWFLLRAVTVRTIKVINSLDFVKEVNIRLARAHSCWYPKICKHLCVSYKVDDLVEVRKSIEQFLEQYSNPKDKSDRRNERNCLETLEILHVIDRNSLSRLMAISYEKEIDYLNSIKDEHTIHMGLEQIAQDAYKEIAKVKDFYPEDFIRIRNKLTNEQKVMMDNIRKYGVKSNYSVSDEFQSMVEESLNNNPMDCPAKLVETMSAISYPDVNAYEKLRENIKEKNFSLWEYFGSSMMGDKGQTVGTASPQDSLNIRTHQVIRQRLNHFIINHIINFLNHSDSFDEAQNIEVIVKTCKSPHISQGRRVLWAMGIIEMMKNNSIASVHILMPQIEHTLLKKAEYYCGSLTKLDREDHQDEPSLKGILVALKPYFKVPFLYNEFEYFFNSGADGNVRNKLAHGLCEIEEIMGFAPYLWWLAIKMFWCDNELFIEKSTKLESNE